MFLRGGSLSLDCSAAKVGEAQEILPSAAKVGEAQEILPSVGARSSSRLASSSRRSARRRELNEDDPRIAQIAQNIWDTSGNTTAKATQATKFMPFKIESTSTGGVAKDSPSVTVRVRFLRARCLSKSLCDHPPPSKQDIAVAYSVGCNV